MRSSAIAGFLASAVFVSGSAGFASTFLVGPYLGAHVRLQPARAELMSRTAPVDPLAVLQTPTRTVASLEGEPAASQQAHRLRDVKNTPQPATTPVVTERAQTKPIATPAVDTTTGTASDPGPMTEAAFASTTPTAAPASSGGPLIAAETSSAAVASKLENGEPVLTLRVVPVIAAATQAVDTTDPDNAVEPTVISAPPTEQALASPAVMTSPAPSPVAAKPVPAVVAEPPARPRNKPALQAPAPAAEPPARRPARSVTVPKRVTTIAAPAPAAARHINDDDVVEPAPVPAPPPPAPDPLNAPYIPPSSPEDPSSATGAPASMTPAPAQPPSTGGPTPLTMPQ